MWKLVLNLPWKTMKIDSFWRKKWWKYEKINFGRFGRFGRFGHVHGQVLILAIWPKIECFYEENRVTSWEKTVKTAFFTRNSNFGRLDVLDVSILVLVSYKLYKPYKDLTKNFVNYCSFTVFFMVFHWFSIVFCRYFCDNLQYFWRVFAVNLY